jgi:hypothetical protein
VGDCAAEIGESVESVSDINTYCISFITITYKSR